MICDLISAQTLDPTSASCDGGFGAVHFVCACASGSFACASGLCGSSSTWCAVDSVLVGDCLHYEHKQFQCVIEHTHHNQCIIFW